MAALRYLVCFFISTLWFFSIINAAAVHNLMFNDEFNVADELDGDRGDIDGIGYAESIKEFVDKIRSRRSLDMDKVCDTMPCGWAVYVPFTRRVDYFMRNTCSCPETYRCIRTDDDLSVSAYVYRCRNNVSVTDILSPSTGN